MGRGEAWGLSAASSPDETDKDIAEKWGNEQMGKAHMVIKG